MASVLAEITRGEVVESRHYGNIAVADGEGRLVAFQGGPETVAYMRSAAKPMQALNVILSGADEEFSLTDKELAIICASHYGEDFHREVIDGILKKLGLPLEALLCGSPLSTSPSYRKKQLEEHCKLTPANSDCSGKHCGFLAVCRKKGYSTGDYNSPEHPLQKEVLKIISDFTAVPEGEIKIGVDGCSVPVHAVPLKNMATAYAKFATPNFAPEIYRNGCVRLFNAMNAYPEMIAGSGGFCTEFLRATDGKFIGKLGAEAVYLIGVKNENLGIAVKIDDGSTRALYPVVLSVLDALGLINEREKEALNSFYCVPVLNNLGSEVGKIRPTVNLTFI